jgi:hypothetical protein
MSASLLLESIHPIICTMHYSIQTEKPHWHWIKNLIFNNKRHANNIGEEEVSHYLTYFAVDRKVTSSVQNLALCSSVFMYQHGLKRELTLLTYTIRAKVATRVKSQRYYLMMRK